jgi:hypothetical protein
MIETVETDYTPGTFVVVCALYCGLCDDRFDGRFTGVVGGRVNEADAGDFDGLGPAPHYHVRKLTCPRRGDSDLYGEDSGAAYSHAELAPAADHTGEAGVL